MKSKSNILDIKTDYLRNIKYYPLECSESAEKVNPQPGKCNNFNYRKNDGEAIYLMQHHTVSDYQRTIEIFTKGATSAHFVINKNGDIQQLVSQEYRAWHAGIGGLQCNSLLNPVIPQNILKNDMNSWSIVIENVNKGNEPFSYYQINSNILLCEKLSNEIPSINPKLMLSHSDWAPGRKIDPSIYFPWELFANASKLFPSLEITKDFGLYPRKAELGLKKDPEVILSYDKYQKKEIQEVSITDVQEMLMGYGYFIASEEKGKWGEGTQNAILAYKIHFAAEEIMNRKEQLMAWEELWKDSTNPKAINGLAQFNENDFECLGDVLDQGIKC